MRVCHTEEKGACQKQQQTFHAHKQKEHYNSSNWPVHQLSTITLGHKIEMTPRIPNTRLNPPVLGP